MFKNILNITFMTAVLCVISSYSAISLSAQDPTRPPSWLTGSANVTSNEGALTLQQVLISQNRRFAVINEKLVSEGDRVAGARVTKIDRDKVIIIRAGQRTTLRLVPITKERINEE